MRGNKSHEKSDLKNLKENYAKIQKKHELPSFEKLNEDFQIEKAAEFETDFLIREIRKIMSEKFSNFLRFTEAVLNPVEVSIFIFSIIKMIGAEEKMTLNEIYKKLANNEIKIIGLEMEFSEKKEAEFINESYKTWQEIKKDFLDILEIIKKNWDNKFEVDKRGYFG